MPLRWEEINPVASLGAAVRRLGRTAAPGDRRYTVAVVHRLPSAVRRRRPTLADLLGELPGLAVAGFLVALSLLAPGRTAAQQADAVAGDEASDAQARPVVHLRIDTMIHGVAGEHLTDGLAHAAELDAEAVVVELSTPGGALETTREMVQEMLAAERPVIVWVAPSGARAASAGFFLLLAGDLAAMAPGTNSGAAHPVGGAGEDIEGHMGAKVEEDTTALVRSLAARHDRNVELAVAAVIDSRSYTADEALEEGLIDFLAPSLGDLLRQVDGRTVVKGGERYVLATAEAEVVEHEMPPLRRILALLVRPEIATLLMGLGFIGLYTELTSPGAIFPGVFGAIALIFAFYALSVLPVNVAGIALIVLAMALFVAETQVPSFGVLTAGGAVALVLGALLLFKDLDPALRLSLELIVAGAAGIVLVVGTLAWRAGKVRRTPVRTGKEGMIHEIGVARSNLTPRGRVYVHGEVWSAEAEGTIAAGTPVEVVAIEGLRLKVRPVGGAEVMAGDVTVPSAPVVPGT